MGVQHNNIPIMQTSGSGILDFYERLLTLFSPTRFYELGCWNGGLSAFMADHGCQAVAVDTDDAPAIHNYPGVVFLRWDYMAAAGELAGMIAREPGRIIVLCDGGGGPGAKYEQAKIYAPLLRIGDILLTHDYHEVEESGGSTPEKLNALLIPLGYEVLTVDKHDPLKIHTSVHIRMAKVLI